MQFTDLRGSHTAQSSLYLEKNALFLKVKNNIFSILGTVNQILWTQLSADVGHCSCTAVNEAILKSFRLIYHMYFDVLL